MDGRVLPAELLREHAGHPPRVPRSTAAGRRSRRGSCSRRRSRRATASTPASSTARTCRCGRAARSTSTRRSTRSKQRTLDGPLLPLVARLNAIAAREPGAAAARQRSRSSRPRTSSSSRSSSGASDNTVIVVRQPRPDARRRRASASCPSRLGLPPAYARARPALGADVRRGGSAATTSASARRAPRPEDRRSDVPTHARPDGSGRPGPPADTVRAQSEQWFERDPLWFKRAVFYEIHIRGFFDGNDDGSGDFRGLIEKLDYLAVARRRLHLAAADVRSRRCATAATTSPTSSRSTPTTGRSTTSASSSRRRTSAACA